MKKISGFKSNEVVMLMVCLLSFGAVTMVGCAGRTKSSVTTQTVDSGLGNGSATSVTTQSRTVTTDAHPRGVIGGIFYTIGQVLIWPFRLIGSLF